MKKLTVNECAQLLKRAVETANFEQAPALIEEYAQAMRQRAQAARTRQERTVILNEAQAFLQDRLHLAQVMRAHIAAQLRSAVGLSGYYGEAATQRSSWKMEG